MKASKFFLTALVFGLAVIFSTSSFAQNRVYGEWTANVKPGKAQAFEELIKNEGLPFFKSGKMIGWWRPFIGDLYEYTWLWEYEDVSEFEETAKELGNDKKFHKFMDKFNELVTAEHSQLIKLPEWAPVPDKIEFPIVIHETHIVKQGHMEPYLEYWRKTALAGLKDAGFRIVGPFVQHTGHSDELLILISFENMAERDRKLGTFGNFSIAQTFGQALNDHITGFHIKVMTPSSIQK